MDTHSLLSLCVPFQLWESRFPSSIFLWLNCSKTFCVYEKRKGIWLNYINICKDYHKTNSEISPFQLKLDLRFKCKLLACEGTRILLSRKSSQFCIHFVGIYWVRFKKINIILVHVYNAYIGFYIGSIKCKNKCLGIHRKVWRVL